MVGTKKPFKKRGLQKRAKTTTKKPISFAKKVMAVVSTQAENKHMNLLFARTNLFVYGNSFWGGAQCFPLSPYSGYANAVQGTAQNQRIANELMIKKATIKLLFNQNAYNVTTNAFPSPLLIKIVTFYDKTISATLPTSVPGFYQNGSSTSDPDANGVNIDILKTFNNDRYVVKSTKTLKMGWSAYDVLGAQNNFQNHQNNNFPMMNTYSLDYTKHLVKKVKYNDTTITPTTRGLFMAIFIMSADGQTIGATQTSCNYQGFIDIQYEDM